MQLRLTGDHGLISPESTDRLAIEDAGGGCRQIRRGRFPDMVPSATVVSSMSHRSS